MSSRVLTADDLRFWDDNGYVVVREAAPPANVQAVIDAIYEFTGFSPDRPEEWNRPAARRNGMEELNGAGMVEMYHHPAMWANRQLPRIHGAFADIWDTEALWVTIDRVNFNPPQPDGGRFAGFIHWDIDTSVEPLPFDVQGVLALTDVAEGGGGFQCVPGMPRLFPEWVKSQPPDRDPNRPDMAGLTVRAVPLRAGDLLIWNSQLAHGVAPNRSSRPRMAQYIAMSPAQEDNAAARQWRIDSWLHRLAPQGDPFPGDPREWERRHGTTAALTPLGRRLLGLDRWREPGAAAAEAGSMTLDQARGRYRATPGFAS
ncbi:MAG: phytanoyl-CoA dioxygenase family protein [Alphaproteobacteria bacterium]